MGGGLVKGRQVVGGVSGMVEGKSWAGFLVWWKASRGRGFWYGGRQVVGGVSGMVEGKSLKLWI